MSRFFFSSEAGTFCIIVLNSFGDLFLTCYRYLAGGSWSYRLGTEGPG